MDSDSTSPHEESPQPLHPEDLPSQLPAMVLSDCVLLPYGLLPLNIFEDRYRLMLKECLQSHRLFCVASAASDPDSSEGLLHSPPEQEKRQVFQHSTLGMIRASRTLPDGSSHLILQGLQRIELQRWIPDTSYPQFSFQLLQNHLEPTDLLQPPLNRVHQQIKQLPKSGVEHSPEMLEALQDIEDPAQACDLISNHLITSAAARMAILQETKVSQRLHILSRCLDQIGA